MVHIHAHRQTLTHMKQINLKKKKGTLTHTRETLSSQSFYEWSDMQESGSKEMDSPQEKETVFWSRYPLPF